MFEHLDDPEPLPLGNEQRAAVGARARTLTMRRRALVSGVAVALLAVLAVPVLLRDDGDQQGVRAIDQPTTSVPTVSTTADTSTTSTPGGRTTTVRGRAAAPQPVATTRACRDSFDPACGPFRWDPAPGENAPMRLSIVASPASPRAGQEVKFTLVADDPDADQFCSAPGLVFGDGDNTNAFVKSVCWGTGLNCEAAFGPWSPPAKRPGHLELTWPHTYDAPGTYTVEYTQNSGWPKGAPDSPWPGGRWPRVGDGCAIHPYGSYGHATTTVVVKEASPLPTD